MPLAKANRPAELKAALTIRGQGVDQKVNLIFNNHTQNEVEEFAKTCESILDFVLFILKEIEDSPDYPMTREGLSEANRDWPGLIDCIGPAFRQAQMVAVVKN